MPIWIIFALLIISVSYQHRDGYRCLESSTPLPHLVQQKTKATNKKQFLLAIAETKTRTTIASTSSEITTIIILLILLIIVTGHCLDEDQNNQEVELYTCSGAAWQVSSNNLTSSFKSRKNQFYQRFLFQKHFFRNGTFWARTL